MIRVREAREPDVPEIARIHVEAWQTSYAGIIPDDYLVRLTATGQQRQWRTSVRRRDHLHRVFVAEDVNPGANGIAGFASCGPARHEKGSRRSPNDGEIFTLYVDPDRQGEGVGRELLMRCLEVLHGENRRNAIVWVLAENQARFFYEALGAQRIAQRQEAFAGTELEMAGYVWKLPVDEATSG